MTARYDRIFKGGTCLTPNGRIVADVGIKDGRIAAIGTCDPASA